MLFSLVCIMRVKSLLSLWCKEEALKTDFDRTNAGKGSTCLLPLLSAAEFWMSLLSPFPPLQVILTYTQPHSQIPLLCDGWNALLSYVFWGIVVLMLPSGNLTGTAAACSHWLYTHAPPWIFCILTRRRFLADECCALFSSQSSAVHVCVSCQTPSILQAERGETESERRKDGRRAPSSLISRGSHSFVCFVQEVVCVVEG